MGISSSTERLYKGNQQRGYYQRIKDTWRLQGDCVFRGNAFLEDFRNILAPYFLVKKFIGGLTVAPHGDGFFLKEARI